MENGLITQTSSTGTIKDASKKTNNVYLFKIILIGDSSTGKTSLIQRFVNNTFEEKHLNTIGVDFFMKTCNIENYQIKLQIWDTAGTEKYKSISSSYYRGSHAAFILFDLTSRQTFDDVNKWLEAFRKTCNPQNKNNVILIGNKNDLKEQRQIEQDDAEAYARANDMIYWETSAKSGENVEDVFGFVTKLLFDNNKKDNFTSFQPTINKGNQLTTNLYEPKKGCCG